MPQCPSLHTLSWPCETEVATRHRVCGVSGVCRNTHILHVQCHLAHNQQTMDTLRDGDELVFLYQLVPGLSDISYACHIAAGVGLPAHIVQRAAEVLM